MNQPIGAIIIGGDFQALGLARSLAENNIPVFLIEYEIGICRYSRYIKRRVYNRSIYNENRFLPYMAGLCKREDLYGWFIYPNNDELVYILSKNKKQLEKYYVVTVPQWDVFQRIYYKNMTNDAANSANIPTPRIYYGENLEAYLKQKIIFPIVLKPTYKEKYFLYTKKKAVRVNTVEEFKTEYKNMLKYLSPDEIIVQEMMLGGPRNLYSYAAVFDQGKIIAGMAARRLRQHPMDFGQATTYAVSANEPILKKLAEKILGELNYEGIAEVEFMKDENDGKFKFIEINGRVWGWHTLAKASGVNLPYILYMHMGGRKIGNFQAKENIKWIRLLTDIPTVAKEIAGHRLTFRKYTDSFNGKREYAVFSLTDPLPFFMECVLIPYLFIKRGF